ncbi:MAG: glycosyltransferase family 39 protein [Chloroflexi bacterium]|nr:glycosyltransferase family 39 protein [Chloroflexota bacterium]
MRRWIPIAILLLAALTRFAAWSAPVRFHGDEALFATYARNAAVYGDWMLPGPLDKPPLSLYAMALSMQFTGMTTLPDGVLTIDTVAGEFAARLPSVFAGIVTVAAVMGLAQALGGPRASLLAGVVTAVSPQMTAFSATAFTDPLLVLFGALALMAAARRQGIASGVLIAAAFASKQQAVLIAPLVVLLLPSRAGWRRFALGALAGVALLLVWDAARPEVSIFAIAADNNNPYRWIVPPAEWPARAAQWGQYLSTAFGPPLWTALICIAGLLPLPIGRNRRTAALRVLTLALLAAHVVLPFNLYDRYLLLLLPGIAVLAALRLRVLLNRRWTAVLALAVMFVGGSSVPARYPTDVRDRDPGLIELAAFVNRQPLGTIVYNPWLGWEMGYYLGPWSDKRVVYYPSPDEFAADAPTNPDTADRLLIAPAWAPVTAWLDAASPAFDARVAYRSADYAAWWLTPTALQPE